MYYNVPQNNTKCMYCRHAAIGDSRKEEMKGEDRSQDVLQDFVMFYVEEH